MLKVAGAEAAPYKSLFWRHWFAIWYMY